MKVLGLRDKTIESWWEWDSATFFSWSHKQILSLLRHKNMMLGGEDGMIYNTAPYKLSILD